MHLDIEIRDSIWILCSIQTLLLPCPVRFCGKQVQDPQHCYSATLCLLFDLYGDEAWHIRFWEVWFQVALLFQYRFTSLFTGITSLERYRFDESYANFNKYSMQWRVTNSFCLMVQQCPVM